MKDRNILIWNMIIFTLLSFFVAGLQTSFWPSLFRVLSNINLWIFLTVYIFLYRGFVPSLVFAYVNTLALHTYTSIPFGLFLALHIVLLLSCTFFRSRIFWTTTSYYLIVCAVSVVVSELAFLVLSYFFEPFPAQHFVWKETFVTLLLTPALGFLFFTLGRFVDSLLPPPQIGGTAT